MLEDSLFDLCPKCHKQINKNTTVCPYCNIEIEKANQTPDSLRFALTEETSLVDLKTMDQVPNKAMIINRRINNILLIVFGVLSFGILFYPLFSKANFYNHLVFLQKYYDYELDSSLAIIPGKTTFMNLIYQGSAYLFSGNNLLTPSGLLAGYELLAALMCIVIAILSILLIAFGIKSIVSTQDYRGHRNIIGTIFAMGLTMFFGLDMFGVGPIFVFSLNFAFLIYIYVSGILTHEKKFNLEHLIFKSVTFGLLLAMLILSSVGSCDLNLLKGASLFKGELIPEANEYMYCRGLFAEVAQFINLVNGVEGISALAIASNIITSITHITYIVLISLCISSILKSLSRQSLRFPEKRIIVTTIFFYVFVLALVFTNSLINNALIEKYAAQIGTDVFYSYDAEQMIAVEKEYNVYFLRGGMIASIIISLPTMIYSIFASKYLVRRKFN